MEIYDDYIPEELFAEFVSQMPQICVEIVFESKRGILLAKRDIEPAIWFWPSSRLYKGEELDDAAHRIAREELGVEVHIIDQYGPYAHFWETSSVEGSPSRHTVNSVFHVEPVHGNYEITLDEQHSEYQYLTDVEDDLHEYVRLYLEDNDLL
jgi:colanic acid biosynthesis protein WcaH